MAALRARLRNVCWIGGGSGAGKSTIARRLAADHGLTVYATDDVMRDHARRSAPEDAPELHRFMDMSMNERWLDRSPETMLDTFHWYRGEGFDLIVEDLLRLSRASGVIAEGFRLLPHLVEPLLDDPPPAVWLLPTPRFRWAALNSRGTAWDIPGGTSDPERAQHNLPGPSGVARLTALHEPPQVERAAHSHTRCEQTGRSLHRCWELRRSERHTRTLGASDRAARLNRARRPGDPAKDRGHPTSSRR